MRVRVQRVRVAATLAGNNQTAFSDWVRCFSARQIGFLVTATNGNPLETENIVVGMDGVNGNSMGSGVMVNQAGSVLGVSLALSGRWILAVPATGLTARYQEVIPWNWCRLVVTTPAAGATPADDITGLQIDAYIWDDIFFAREGKGLPPLLPS